MTYSIQHQGYLPLDFIWGTHPAYAIREGCILHIPGKTGIVGQANHASLGSPGQRYEWPVLNTAGGSMNMSRVAAPGRLSSGHYVTDLAAGWYALEYPDLQLGLLFEFPLELCPYLWLWLSYGGWRGHYVAAIEPWTSFRLPSPMRLLLRLIEFFRRARHSPASCELVPGRAKRVYSSCSTNADLKLLGSNTGWAEDLLSRQLNAYLLRP